MNTPRLRLDKSKPFSTIHGDRPPGDPHATVHSYQDGLPFDAQGFYVPDVLNDASDKDGKLRAMVERRLRKLADAQTEADVDAEIDEEVSGSLKKPGDGADEVNLEAWARGEAVYLFGDVRKAIEKRFSIKVTSQKAAIEALVIDFQIIGEDEMGPTFKAMLNPPKAA